MIRRGCSARTSAAQRRSAVDAAFARMADDPEYQAEAVRIAEEYAAADREALRLGSMNAGAHLRGRIQAHRSPRTSGSEGP